MVFRWLFSSSSNKPAAQPTTEPTPEQPPAEQPEQTDQVYPAPEEPIPDPLPEPIPEPIPDPIPAEDAPPISTTTGPLKVPLNAIPAFMVEERPTLKLSNYDMNQSQYCSNVLALTHNAIRLEMADMWGDILPSLESRCQMQNETNLTQADADDIIQWWTGFARFALTASLVEDLIIKAAFNDVHVGYDKETKVIQKSFQKVQERNNVYLEMAIRKMESSVDDFERDVSFNGFIELGKAWEMLAAMLAEIYHQSENLVVSIDRWLRKPVEHKGLEKTAVKIFTSKKRWGQDDSKRGEMIIMLCRWLGTEELMREWMVRNMTKKELRSIDRWMDEYRDNRLAVIDRFHQKKAELIPE